MLHPIQNRTTQIPTSTPETPSNLLLMPTAAPPHVSGPALLDLVVIASKRCSSFFAEAAVLVLVFGILDYFMLKGRIELPWIIGALAISVLLLACSIAMDFVAQRWVRAHP
jgi:small neutral amino acid transporter SnatA (MarC family)